jgi:hypothetical protein
MRKQWKCCLFFDVSIPIPNPNPIPFAGAWSQFTRGLAMLLCCFGYLIGGFLQSRNTPVHEMVSLFELSEGPHGSITKTVRVSTCVRLPEVSLAPSPVHLRRVTSPICLLYCISSSSRRRFCPSSSAYSRMNSNSLRQGVAHLLSRESEQGERES